MLGKIAADAWGWTEKLGGEKNQVVKIRTEVDDEEVDALQAEIAKLDGDEVRIRAVVDKSSLRDIDGLADYAVSQSKNGKSISFEGVNQLNNDYIAKQAHGFAGVNTAIKEYNRLKDESTEKANKFAETIGKSNANLGKYLSGLKNTTGGMSGYAVSLVGATAKTIALEVATTAMNAAISMGVSLLVQGLISGVSWLFTYNQRLEESRQEMIEVGKEAAQFTKDLDSLVEEYRKLGTDGTFDNSDREQAKNIQKQINELLGEEVSNINLANADYKEQLKLLRDLQYEKAKEKDYDLETAYTSSKESLLYKADDVGAGAWVADSEVDAVNNLKSELEDLDKYIHTHKATGNGDANTAFFKVDTSSAEAVVESYEKMVEIKRVLEDAHRDEIQAGGVLEDFYNNLKEEINDLSDAVNKYKDAMSNYNVNQAVIMFNERAFDGLPDQFKNLTGATIENKEQLSAWMTAMMGAKGVSDDIKYNLIGLAKTNYPELSEEIDKSSAEFVRGKISSGNFKGSLATVASQCGTTTSALATMILKMIDLNETKLNLGQQISEIVKLRAAMGLSEFKDSDIYDAGFKWVRKGTYALDGKEYTMDEARYKVIYDTTMHGLKNFGGDTNNDTPPYTPSGKDNTPDYEDPTDAIINRINLRSKELEQQEESIDNALELAEYEKNNEKRYEKQVSLLTEKSTIQKQRLGEIVKANNDIHKVAEELRNSTPDWDEESWFDSQGEATEAYLKLYNNSTKEQQEALSDQFDKLSKLKKAWYENDEDRLALEKDILDTEEEILDLRAEYFNKATDFHSSYFDSRISVLEAQYELENSIAEARHELNKELETSKTMYEYLDEETRELLFNQEDYNKLSEKLLSIEKRGDRLQSQYEKDLQNATLETVEKITANYERQYETLMKSYEIAKADLEIAKKKQQLNNVLNERNVRMFLDGQWRWVADTEEVARAKSELADAEYAKRVAKAGLKQQESINNLTLQQDQLGIVVKKFENGVITLDEAIIDAAKAIDKLPKALQEMYQNASKGNTSSSSNPFGTGNSSPSGASGGSTYTSNPSKEYVSWAKAQMAENSKNWHTADANGKKALEAANQSLGAAIGSTYDEASGTWKHQYATGSKYTKDGLSLLGEAGSEVYITSNGRLIPINQPTIGNIPSGGVVFNQDQMRGLRTLWDMSNLNLNPDRVHIERQPQQIDQSQDNRIIINGMTVDSGSSDGQALISALRRYVSNH